MAGFTIRLSANPKSAGLHRGRCANTAIFSLVNEVLLKSLPVKNPEELVLLSWRAVPIPRRLSIAASGDPPATLVRPRSVRIRAPTLFALGGSLTSGVGRWFEARDLYVGAPTGLSGSRS